MSLLIGTSSADGNWVYRMGSIDSAMIAGTLEVVCGWTRLNVRLLIRARGMTLCTRIGFVNEGHDFFTDIIVRQILDLDSLKVCVIMVLNLSSMGSYHVACSKAEQCVRRNYCIFLRDLLSGPNLRVYFDEGKPGFRGLLFRHLLKGLLQCLVCSSR